MSEEMSAPETKSELQHYLNMQYRENAELRSRLASLEAAYGELERAVERAIEETGACIFSEEHMGECSDWCRYLEKALAKLKEVKSNV